MKVGTGGNLGLSREYHKKLFGPLFYSWWNCPLRVGWHFSCFCSNLPWTTISPVQIWPTLIYLLVSAYWPISFYVHLKLCYAYFHSWNEVAAREGALYCNTSQLLAQSCLYQLGTPRLFDNIFWTRAFFKNSVSRNVDLQNQTNSSSCLIPELFSQDGIRDSGNIYQENL